MRHLTEIVSLVLYTLITLTAVGTYVFRRTTHRVIHLRAILILWLLGVFLVALVVVVLSMI